MSLVRDWSEEPIPEHPEWAAHDYRYTSFSTDFKQVMEVTWKGPCNSLERLAALSTRIYEDLWAQKVRYLEMSFGIGAYPYPASETLEALKSGAPDGMTVRLIGALSRDRDIPKIREAARGYLEDDAMDGVDIHGNEHTGDPMAFADFYEEARSRELILKAHAGEMRGPESIVEMLDKLGVKRIQHGVRGIESDVLLARLIEEDVTLDLCPWSNVKLGFYPNLETHPVADLHRKGVRVTVNTDDPTPFGQTITEEFSWLLTERGMSVAEVGAIARNGFEIARMPDKARASAMTEIDGLVAEFSKEAT
jgi:adenosine deaminase